MVRRSKTSVSGCLAVTGVLVGALLWGGCQSESAACLVGSDCASGACGADGVCVPAGGSTGAADTGTVGGTESGDDVSSTRTDMEGSGESSVSSDPSDTSDTLDTTETTDASADCMPPNGDAVIENTELFFDPGLQSNYLATQDVTFDTAGATVDGERRWDFSVDLTGDHASSSEFLSIEGQWYEPLFPGASYAARLTDSADLLGVFEVTDPALVLRGVVSPSDGSARTELVYDPPATVLSFPLFEGQSWTSDSNVSGVAQGVAVFYTESYENSVDASGVVVTKFGDFEALRLGVVLTRTIGVVTTVVRSYSFISECVGTVATVRSNDNEESQEFTQVSEVRRLDP